MKNEAMANAIMKHLLREYEAKRAGEESFFMMRSIASCAQHTSCAVRRASLKKAHCESNELFSGSIELNVYCH